MQLIGIFLLTVVAVALVAGINLNVTSRAATFGRQIQDMAMTDFSNLEDVAIETEEQQAAKLLTIEDYKIAIADLEGQLAVLTSAEVMRERAEGLGFVRVNPEELVYLKVAGYSGRSEVVLAPATKPITTGAKLIPQAYRESLMDWLSDEISHSWLLRSPSDLLIKGVNP